MAETQTKNRSGAAVYDTLREMAVEYRFRPGDKINEVDLSATLGVSRTPIREALNRLVSEDLIVFRKNYGFYCRNLDLAEVQALNEALRDLMGVVLSHIAERGDPAALAAFRDDWAAMVPRIAELPACDVARADESYFNRLAGLSGNPVLAGITRNVVARVRFLRKILLEDPAARPAHFAEQVRMLEALSKRTDVAEAMAVHLTPDPEALQDALTKGLGRLYLTQIHMDVTLSP